jgi:hypothetical protein
MYVIKLISRTSVTMEITDNVVFNRILLNLAAATSIMPSLTKYFIPSKD